MTKLSLFERLEEDQSRLGAAIERQRLSRNPVTRLLNLVQVEYLGAVVQQDLEDVELAEYAAMPEQRTPLE